MRAAGRLARFGAGLGILALTCGLSAGTAGATVSTENVHGTALAGTTIFTPGGGIFLEVFVTPPANCPLRSGTQYVAISVTGNGVSHANLTTGPRFLVTSSFNGTADVVPASSLTSKTLTGLSTPAKLSHAKAVLAAITVATGRMTTNFKVFGSGAPKGHETIHNTFNLSFKGTAGTTSLSLSEHGHFNEINVTPTTPTSGTVTLTTFSATCFG